MRVVPVGNSAILIICSQVKGREAETLVQTTLCFCREYVSPSLIRTWVPAYTCILGFPNPKCALSMKELAESVSGTVSEVVSGIEGSLPLGNPGSVHSVISVNPMSTVSSVSSVSSVNPLNPVSSGRPVVEIPVCYELEYAPDLEDVAKHLNTSTADVISRHAKEVYTVAFLGFVPGFAYMTGLPEELAVPRLPSPRTVVPPGSVGIGGEQTGVYPSATPGGWRIIGRTPLQMFNPNRQTPSLLQPGDAVRFVPISAARFTEISNCIDVPGTESEVPRTIPMSDYASKVMSIENGGLFTTVQDPGRRGYEPLGVAQSGWLDDFAARVANRIVQNPSDAAVLECTLVGPVIRFHRETTIALTGANMGALLNGEPVPLWREVRVDGGSVLKMGMGLSGCRSYLAVAGGIDVPLVMESRSTYAGQMFGGFHGRALAKGDVVRIALSNAEMRGATPVSPARRGLAREHIPRYADEIEIGFIPSQHPSRVGADVLFAFTQRTWQVSPSSNRMGIRLEEGASWGDGGAGGQDGAAGPGQRVPEPRGPLLKTSVNTVSEPIVPGTIQLPPGGNPIVLMNEAQTVGGYPTLGFVCRADMGRLAQLRPGGRVRFTPISEAEAGRRMQALQDVIDWLERW